MSEFYSETRVLYYSTRLVPHFAIQKGTQGYSRGYTDGPVEVARLLYRAVVRQLRRIELEEPARVLHEDEEDGDEERTAGLQHVVNLVRKKGLLQP